MFCCFWTSLKPCAPQWNGLSPNGIKNCRKGHCLYFNYSKPKLDVDTFHVPAVQKTSYGEKYVLPF